ncbi:MAG: beta-galactosidase [Muribaculaceae bacterium]|nr:beta-galactosidase [Muribaculaceae bacterium]
MISRLKLLIAAIVIALGTNAHTFEADTVGGVFRLDGQPFIIKAAELHYPRIPRPYWEHRIKMCKALGMNTICLYVFWNVHEQVEGTFDFTGQNDVAEFCRLAQRHGMWVIVRPEPYVCAEWEMGGLPWWLLKADIPLRSCDKRFIDHVRRFENEVGRQLAPLTINNGGPIIMVQVENEMGSYGTDPEYVAAVRDIVRQAGFNGVTLFQCDWSSNFEQNALPDLLWTMNFGTGSDVDKEFARLRELRPRTPLMCSEYWSGWFDKWGAAHETRPADEMVAGVSHMLEGGISFSLYMTHGGTSFGHWAGANSPGYAPDVTSYDYDAPINEWGLPTDKFDRLRGVLLRDNPLAMIEAVPEPPHPIVSLPALRLSDHAPLHAAATGSIHSERPLTFEQMDMGFGAAIYTATLADAATDSTTLDVPGCHDWARVTLDGRPVGTLNRAKGTTTLRLPPHAAEARLELLVEGMGRINFGRGINDHKGIIGDVSVNGRAVTDWDIALLPDEYSVAANAFLNTQQDAPAGKAGYYRGTFVTDSLHRIGDTFLDLSHWGKGQVWVNGHALGRFWHIGPQQTLYLPGCWLQEGENEVVVLDLIGPEGEPTIAGLAEPILDRPGKAEATIAATRPVLHDWDVAMTMDIAAGNNWQTFELAKPLFGRLIIIECSQVWNEGDAPAIAEVRVIDSNGNDIDPSRYTVHYVDSEDFAAGNNNATKAIDLQESTRWQAATGSSLPQLIVIDLGTDLEVTALRLLSTGTLKTARLYLR